MKSISHQSDGAEHIIYNKQMMVSASSWQRAVRGIVWWLRRTKVKVFVDLSASSHTVTERKSRFSDGWRQILYQFLPTIVEDPKPPLDVVFVTTL